MNINVVECLEELAIIEDQLDTLAAKFRSCETKEMEFAAGQVSKASSLVNDAWETVDVENTYQGRKEAV